jgi:hypothetical protein
VEKPDLEQDPEALDAVRRQVYMIGGLVLMALLVVGGLVWYFYIVTTFVDH